MPQTAEQNAALQELYRRREGLDPDRRAAVEELMRRYSGVEASQTTGERLGIEPGRPADTQDPATRMLGQVREMAGRAAPFTVDPLVGAAKGVGSTAFGIRNIIERATGREPSERPDFLDPKNTGEKVGYFGEQVAEFALPAAAASRVPAVANVLAKGGKAALGARTAIEGVGAGLVSGAQTGGDVSEAGLDAALDAAFTLSFGSVGAVLGRGGRRAMSSAISPSAADFKQGFKAENIFKHKLQGTVPQMAKKTSAELDRLAGQLQDAIARHGDVQVDALDLLVKAADDVHSTGLKNFGKRADLDSALNKFTTELQFYSPDGKVGLVDAQKLKQSVGEMGAWADGVTQLDMRAVEALSNAYYQRLRKAVEVGAPEVKAINQALSEIIPINSALIRRLPAQEKARLFELGELIVMSGGAGALMGGASMKTTATGTAGLLLLSRMTRSATGGRIMHRASEVGPTLGRILGRTAAGATGTIPMLRSRDE